MAKQQHNVDTTKLSLGPVTALGQVVYVATSRLAFSIDNELNHAHRETEREPSDYAKIRDMLGLGDGQNELWVSTMPGYTIPLTPERLPLYQTDMTQRLDKMLADGGTADEGVVWHVLTFMGVVSGKYEAIPVAEYRKALVGYVKAWKPDLEVVVGAGRCWEWSKFGKATSLPFVDVSGLDTNRLDILALGTNLNVDAIHKPLTAKQWAGIIQPNLSRWTTPTEAARGIANILPTLGIVGVNPPKSQVVRGFALAKLSDKVKDADLAMVVKTITPEELTGLLLPNVHGTGKDSGFKPATADQAKAVYQTIVERAAENERAATVKRGLTDAEKTAIKAAESVVNAFAKRAKDIANKALGNLDGMACLQYAIAEQVAGDDASRKKAVADNDAVLAKYTASLDTPKADKPTVVKDKAKAETAKPVTTAAGRKKAK